MYKLAGSNVYPASSTESFPSSPLPNPSPSQYAQAHSPSRSQFPRCSPEPDLVLQPDLAVTADSQAYECDWETEDFTLDRHQPFGGKRLRIICRRIGSPQVTGRVSALTPLDYRHFDYDLPHKKPRLGARYQLDVYEGYSDGRKTVGIALFRKGFHCGRMSFTKTVGEKLVRALRAGVQLTVKVQRLEERRTKKGLKVIAGRVWLEVDLL